MKSSYCFALSVAALISAPLGLAETSTIACQEPIYHQFDFLVGEWQVVSEDGTVVGDNSISRQLDGCLLEEDWRGVSGERGRSLIFYDKYIKSWQQTWMDNRGSSLRLEGGWRDGYMLLSGQKPNSTEFHEISWQLLPDGSIKQHWRMTTNQGKSWMNRFTGYYKTFKSPGSEK